MALRRRVTKDNFLNHIYVGDSASLLKKFENNSINLIVTSPPYANQRKATYGGVHPDKYVDWFKPIAVEMYRVLKSDGSFILNIKESVVQGERHTYVLNLILMMKELGWNWTEEYMWHKKNCFPGKWPNRFRDSFERCLHFTKEKKFFMDQESVMVPMGDWKEKRFKFLGENDVNRHDSQVGNKFSKNISNWEDRTKAYPTNVLHMATECNNRGHSAVFPLDLPTWFIKLFSKPGDVILDPFSGSGTTAKACVSLDRNYVGIELNEDYAKQSTADLKKFKPSEVLSKRKSKEVTRKKISSRKKLDGKKVTLV